MTTYYLVKRESLFIAVVSLIAAVVVFIVFVIYNDYKGHERRVMQREVKADIRQLAPEPEHKVAKLPIRKEK